MPILNPVLVSEDESMLDGNDTSNDEINITSPFDTSKIRVETKNTQMDAIIKRIKNSEIDLAPSFQRQGGIWSDIAQSRLIESMLIKIPLPAFYMDASDDNNWLIVDGLQRLTTIRRFVIDKSLLLTGLEFLTEYNGKDFDNLPRSFQRRIEETDIVLYLIQPGTPPNVKFDIFRRINTGGEPLSAQEIRHALNQGQVTIFLKSLAQSDEFRFATFNGVSSKRMDDRECVLRFLAFNFFKASTYDDDNFDRFLNNAMAHANELSKEKLDSYAELFKKSMICAKSIFGKNSFRKLYGLNNYRYPINKALFEAWSVNLSGISDAERAILLERKNSVIEKFTWLMSNDYDFEQSISQGTGSVKRVRYRFNKIKNLIQEVIS